LPALIGVIMKTGTYLDVEAYNYEGVLYGIFATAIEKAGALIDRFETF
jgi:hypothetical protein